MNTITFNENNCPWDSQTCDSVAAGNGHLYCLKYLHENGRPRIHSRPNLKIYSREFDIQAEKEDPDTECSICYTNRNKVEFKPCNHTLCIECSNKIITKNNNKNKDTTCPFCRGNVEKNLLLTN